MSRTYTTLAISQSLAISQCTSSESAKHELRNALSILTLRSLKSTKPVAYLWHHVDRCNTGHYTCSLTLRRMNSPRARKWSRKKLSDTARGRPTETRERLRIAHLSVNATQLHQKFIINAHTSDGKMGLSFTNPETSVERTKEPHETWSQICSTRT